MTNTPNPETPEQRWTVYVSTRSGKIMPDGYADAEDIERVEVMPVSEGERLNEALERIADLAGTTWRDADVSENALYEVFGDLAGMAEEALRKNGGAE